MEMHTPSLACHRNFGGRPRKYEIIMQLVLNDKITVHSTYHLVYLLLQLFTIIYSINNKYSAII